MLSRNKNKKVGDLRVVKNGESVWRFNYGRENIPTKILVLVWKVLWKKIATKDLRKFVIFYYSTTAFFLCIKKIVGIRSKLKLKKYVKRSGITFGFKRFKIKHQ